MLGLAGVGMACLGIDYFILVWEWYFLVDFVLCLGIVILFYCIVIIGLRFMLDILDFFWEYVGKVCVLLK